MENYDRSCGIYKVIGILFRNCGYNPYVKCYETYYRIRVNSKELYSKISTMTPDLLKEPTIPFIRGLFDSEGTQYYDSRKRKPLLVVEIANTKQTVISEISRPLDRHGVKHSIKPYEKTGKKPLYKVVIRGANAYEAFKINQTHAPS